jgi:hypothetical protein
MMRRTVSYARHGRIAPPLLGGKRLIYQIPQKIRRTGDDKVPNPQLETSPLFLIMLVPAAFASYVAYIKCEHLPFFISSRS